LCSSSQAYAIEHGDLPDDFNAEENENLIAVSLQEIQSACLNQSSIDWPLFAKRMYKIEMFLKYFDLNQDKSLDFARSYVVAMRLSEMVNKAPSWPGQHHMGGLVRYVSSIKTRHFISRRSLFATAPYAGWVEVSPR
jgi:hypothetical protein